MGLNSSVPFLSLSLLLVLVYASLAAAAVTQQMKLLALSAEILGGRTCACLGAYT